MREILFRGKRIDNGEWVEGAYIPQYYSTRYGKVAAIFMNDDTYRFPVDPATVGQYTGLKDKNGKRIFEGDICQISDSPFVVEWKGRVYNGWTWKDLDANRREGSFTIGLAKCCEVIGNIHDNPELMEVR